MIALTYVEMDEKDGFKIPQKKLFGTSQQLRLLLQLMLKTANIIMVKGNCNSE
jgi:hypothetical protein